MAFDTGLGIDASQYMSDEAAELYVLESPFLGNGNIRLKMYERDIEPTVSQPKLQRGWSTIPRQAEVPETFDL
jgi:hypothetical protein